MVYVFITMVHLCMYVSVVKPVQVVVIYMCIYSLVLLLQCLPVAGVEGSITLVDLLDLKQLTGIGH